MTLYLALGLALFCFWSNSYAGITFSNLGKADQSMLIPDFSSPREALAFANRVKGNDDAIEDMKKHMEWLRYYAEHPKEITAPEEEWRKQYRLQWARCAVALQELIKIKDQAQIGNHGRFQFEIPYFGSKGDAIRWANQVGYTEPLRRQLRNRAQWFRDLAYLGSDPTLYQIEMATHYAKQHELCEFALSIMNNLRAHGVKGEPVGSLFFASSVPVKR